MVVQLRARDAWDLFRNGRVVMVDVREPAEWARGHIPGARLLSFAELRRAGANVLGADPIVFVCAGGVRSQTAARFAQQHGVESVYNLAGGMRSWIKAGLPLANALSVAV